MFFTYSTSRRKAALPEALAAAREYLEDRFEILVRAVREMPLTKEGVLTAKNWITFAGVHCPWAKSAIIKYAHGLTPKFVLLAVRDLLAERERWTQHLAARDANGECVVPTSPSAKCWCLLGAIDRCAPKPDVNAATGDLLRSFLPGGVIVEWNDHERRTHAEVLGFIDRALRYAK
jgi:hypothetical protein